MISKNILAALVLVAIVISLASTYVMMNDSTEEVNEVAGAVARVEVVAAPEVAGSTGQAMVNVIPKGG